MRVLINGSDMHVTLTLSAVKIVHALRTPEAVQILPELRILAIVTTFTFRDLLYIADMQLLSILIQIEAPFRVYRTSGDQRSPRSYSPTLKVSF